MGRPKYKGSVILRAWRLRFYQYLRLLAYSICRLWLRRIVDPQNLPANGPAIIVSNHLSYYDWALLSAIYWKKHLVFIGNQDLRNRFFVRFLVKFNILIFIDPAKPRLSYFRESVGYLKRGEILVVYPEGTRSKSGKMLDPKIGFVQLALHTGVPVIPVGMKGTYEILPPQKRWPAFRRCDIVVGKPVRIDRDEPLFRDIPWDRLDGRKVSEPYQERIAFIIMDIVARMTGQAWEESVLRKFGAPGARSGR